MSDLAKVESQPYSSLKDLNRLKRVYRDKNKLLEEYASREFQDESAPRTLDLVLDEQLSIIDTLSQNRASSFEEVMLKFDLWMEDYQSSDRMLSNSSEELLFAVYYDLKEYLSPA